MLVLVSIWLLLNPFFLQSDFVAQKRWSQLASVDSTQLMLIKALFSARDILLEDLKEISKAIDQAIDLDDMLFGSMDGEVPVQLLGMPQNGVEVFTSFLALNYFCFFYSDFINTYCLPFLSFSGKQMVQKIFKVMVCLTPYHGMIY